MTARQLGKRRREVPGYPANPGKTPVFRVSRRRRQEKPPRIIDPPHHNAPGAHNDQRRPRPRNRPIHGSDRRIPGPTGKTPGRRRSRAANALLGRGPSHLPKAPGAPTRHRRLRNRRGTSRHKLGRRCPSGRPALLRGQGYLPHRRREARLAGPHRGLDQAGRPRALGRPGVVCLVCQRLRPAGRGASGLAHQGDRGFCLDGPVGGLPGRPRRHRLARVVGIQKRGRTSCRGRGGRPALRHPQELHLQHVLPPKPRGQDLRGRRRRLRGLQLGPGRRPLRRHLPVFRATGGPPAVALRGVCRVGQPGAQEARQQDLQSPAADRALLRQARGPAI